MLKKLTSRKLWVAIAGIAVGLAAMFGIDGESIETVAGALVSIASVLGYIITEGRIDAANAGSAPIETGRTIAGPTDGTEQEDDQDEPE